MTSQNIKSPLIVDPDGDFLNKLVASAKQSAHAIPHVAKLGAEAQAILSNSDQQCSALFVNPNVTGPMGISVIQTAYQFRPGMPIYLITDGNIGLNESDLQKLGVQKCLKKPLNYNQIIELIRPKAVNEPPPQSSQLSTDNVRETDDAEYVPISAAHFLSGSICYFDIYIRIGQRKYIKILQAGNAFAQQRLEDYISKGVTHLYISKAVQQQYVSYCDRLATSLLNSSKATIEVKTSQALNHGEETLAYLQSVGVDKTNLALASKFVHNVQGLIRQLGPDNQNVLKDFLSDVVTYDHGVGVSTIASLLFRPLKIVSADPVEAVGLSCFFHDIGLKRILPQFIAEDESQMPESQRRLYATHPTVGAKLLAQIRGIKPVVVQAVEQHHERRSGRGFPNGTGAAGISLIAEVVGISDEFFRILEKYKTQPNFDYKAEIERRIFGNFSTPLLQEFKKVFKSML